MSAAPPRPRQAPRPPLEPHQQDPTGTLAAFLACRTTDDINNRFILPAWRRGVALGLAAGIVATLCALALAGCSATVETDNTPWGKARVATEAKPPPPIYSRSSRSTVTKPPPPAPEVEETTCENGVCGVPGR